MSINKDKIDNIQKDETFGCSCGSSDPKLPNKFDEILGRLKLVFGVETDTDFARCMGFKQGSVSGAKQKQAIPPAWITEVALSKDVSADWLLTGEGEMKRGGKKYDWTSSGIKRIDRFEEESIPIITGTETCLPPCLRKDAAASRVEAPTPNPLYNGKDSLTCDCELMMVPLVEARLSVGGESWETSSDSDRRYAFRTDFLSRKGNASTMVLMRVAGDSMDPEIKDNDVVLIDTSNTTPRPGRLFAIAIENLVYVKKVDAAPGRLVLTSANPAYSPLEIEARGDLKNGIRIIGRAVWVGRELD